MPKKTNRTSTKHISHNSTHILVKKSVALYAIVVFLVFFVGSLMAGAAVQRVHMYQVNERTDRVTKTYDSLALDTSYRVDTSDIYGGVRLYGSGLGRTQTSVVTYGKDASRSSTFEDLEKRITSAGFKKLNTLEQDGLARQDQYKNADNEYIIVGIETRSVRDASLYGSMMPDASSPEATETGPVYVTIRVNLDLESE